MAVDTLQLSKDLQDVAFTRDQADVLARIILEHTNGRLQGETEGLARRLDDVEAAIQDLRAEFKAAIEELRAEIKASQGELRAELEAANRELRAEIKASNAGLRAEIKEGDASLKVDLIKWIVGSLVLNLVGTAGLMITLIKLIPH